MTAAAATDSSPVTLAQRGSIGRLLARIQSINPAIKNIWVADSEFHSEFRAPGSELMDGNGGHQVPVCFVFHNPITGETIEQFYRPGESIPPCPISLGPDTLLVAFAATAELKTMLRLWRRMSARILDLDIEWRHLNNEEHRLDQMKSEAKSANKNGDVSPMSLLGACAVNGIVTRSQEHKDAMRKLILGAGPWTPAQEREILDYCGEDVCDTTALLAAMWEKTQDTFYCRQRIDGLKATLHRGRMMVGFAWMEDVGIPIDADLNARLTKHFDSVMNELYAEIREEFPVFNDDSYDIAPSKWAEFLKAKGWFESWPKTKGGKKRDKKQPKRDVKKTIPQMTLIYPELKKLSSVLEIRSSTKLGLRFPVGPDNRHRVNFWPYGTITGRCSPSSSEYMLAGGSPAFRHLAKPAEGEILIEADWSAQEVWIAAHLSGDEAMIKMLRAADPYIAFGELAGVIPAGSLEKLGVKECKIRYAIERERLKAITLGVLYGKTHYTVAAECGITQKEAKELLNLHKRLFPQFWNWINWVVNEALATNRICTRLGWQRVILPKRERDALKTEDTKHKKIQNSLQNFQAQAHGSEMLRLACAYATEIGLGVCAPLHDAIFAVAKIEDEEKALAGLKACMNQASINLIGVAIPVESSVTRYPDRFVPTKKPMAITVWKKMMDALNRAEEREKDESLLRSAS